MFNEFVPGASKNIPVPATDPSSWFGLKFHQVAIYSANVFESVNMWKDMGYEDWTYDEAILSGTEWGKPGSKKAFMAFNYDILPNELEFVHYSAPTRHLQDERDGNPPFISHMSVMVDDVQWETLRIFNRFGMKPYHEFLTGHHTNERVKGRKRFKEAIYDTRGLLGFDLKLIQRVPWDYKG